MKRNLIKNLLGAGALAASLLSAAALAETRYVTDELEITLRSGQSTRNSIVRMLKAGTAVDVVEESAESGYSRVRLGSGAEGWVLTRFLVDAPVARAVLPGVQRQLAALQENSRSAGGELQEVRNALDSLQATHDALVQAHDRTTRELLEVREKSADVLSIDSQNSELRKRLTVLEGENDQLRILNEELSNRRTLEWFMAGGGVLFFGLLLGLILPRIRWRRRSSWGDL